MERIIQTALVLGIGSRCARKTDWTPLQDHVDPELRPGQITDIPAEVVTWVTVETNGNVLMV